MLVDNKYPAKMFVPLEFFTLKGLRCPTVTPSRVNVPDPNPAEPVVNELAVKLSAVKVVKLAESPES